MKELNTEHSGTEENKTHLALESGFLWEMSQY